MKKLTILALVFVLTASMFAGCRRNGETTAPGTTAATNKPATTAPHTTGTRPSGSTAPNGTELLPETPDGTTGSGYARRMLPPRY